MLHRKLRLVGYVRGGGGLTDDEQRRIIEDYCTAHDYKIIKFTAVDGHHASFGLQEAMSLTNQSDGIIVADLDALVLCPHDRLLTIRPVAEQLLHHGKVLIAVLNGVETVTATGQHTLLQMIGEWSEREAISPPTRGDFESAMAGHHHFDSENAFRV